MGAKWFGAAVKRKEDPALLAGRGRFVDDIRLPGTLHAAFVRSPHPHAKIRAVRHRRGARAARRASRARLRRPAGAAAPQRAAAVRAEPGDHRALHALCAGEHRDGLCRRAGRHGGGRHALSRRGRRRAGRGRLRAAARRCPIASPRWSRASPRAHAGCEVERRRPRADHRRRCRCRVRQGARMWSRERIFIHRGGPFFLECRGLVASYDAIADALHDLHLLAGVAPHQARAARRARSQRQPDARRHARRRRRLRAEGRDLSRISLRRRLRAAHSAGR